MAHSIDRLLDYAADRVEAGRNAALCLLVKTRGSTPAQAGALMVVDDQADMCGTIGGGCVEAEVRKRVISMINDGKTGVMQFQMNHDYGWDDGLLCGGTIDLAIGQASDVPNLRDIAESVRKRAATSLPLRVHDAETGVDRKFVLDLPPRPRLYIAGAGHIGQALTRYGLDLDFEVSVFDDRADLLDHFIPEPATRVSGAIEKTMLERPIDHETYIVIVTRGHRHDEKVLKAIAEAPARYVGMIGSRRKVKVIFDDLRDLGISEDVLARVRAPIGLEIGSVTVNEIAMSIAAEIVQVRRSDHRSPVTEVEAPATEDASCQQS